MLLGFIRVLCLRVADESEYLEIVLLIRINSCAAMVLRGENVVDLITHRRQWFPLRAPVSFCRSLRSRCSVSFWIDALIALVNWLHVSSPLIGRPARGRPMDDKDGARHAWRGVW